jgi:uncharacterized protein (TIGR03790 family)
VRNSFRTERPARTRFQRLSALLLFATFHAAPLARAAETPGAEAVVIYNTAVPESREVAQHYAERRGVPAPQVIGLDLPTSETLSRAEFENRLQKPLVAALTERELLKLRDEIRPASETSPGRVVQIVTEARARTLVLCYGVPLRVAPDPTLSEPGALVLPEPLRNNQAAVDAELTALPLLLAGQLRAGPIPNPWFGVTNAALLTPPAGVFVVGRLDGPTAALARALVDRAMEAEENGLWGRGYFDLRATTEPAYLNGDRWISNAWAAVKSYGYDSYLDAGPATIPAGFPLSQVAFYAGWYDANASGPFAAPQVEFMPGAVAYHLHSFSAATLRSTNQNWVGPLVARGVTATFGMVAEPYLDGTPDIGAAYARLLYFGFSWGEAAIAAQRMLSWQLTVVGDPLYRPFRLNALERAKLLAARANPRIDWALAVLYNRKRDTTGDLTGAIRELSAEPRLRLSSILQEKLADFQTAAGAHAEAAESYHRASRLLTSVQQRRRLLWRTAEAFEAAGKRDDAYDAYRQYARDVDPPADPALLYERLMALARALGKDSDVRRWTRELDRLQPPPPPR